jgi:hypothetical protein
MKKIAFALLFVAALFLPSCTSDDSTDKRTIKAKIDGIEHIFNTVQVEETPYPDEGYTDVTISATLDNDPSKMVSIIVTQGVTGDDASWYFAYFLDETAYPKNDAFTTNVDKSTNNHVKGTFSGTVISTEDDSEIVFTDGTFDVTY